MAAMMEGLSEMGDNLKMQGGNLDLEELKDLLPEGMEMLEIEK